MDNLHAYLHRINGCIYISLAVIPWIGQRFRYSEDKHTVLMARVVVSVCWSWGRGREAGVRGTVKSIPLRRGDGGRGGGGSRRYREVYSSKKEKKSTTEMTASVQGNKSKTHKRLKCTVFNID